MVHKVVGAVWEVYSLARLPRHGAEELDYKIES